MSEENKLEFVTVKAANEDGKVALYETHLANVTDENETGEVFVAGDGKAVKVARTPTVVQKLRDGVLVEVNTPDIAPAPQEAPKHFIPEHRPGEPMGQGSGMPRIEPDRPPFTGEQPSVTTRVPRKG